MFRIAALVAVAGAVVLGATQATGQENVPEPDNCQPRPLSAARAIVKEAWDREGWRQRNPVKKSQTQELTELRGCLDANGRKKLESYAAKMKADHRFHRTYRMVAPYSGFSGEGYLLRWTAIPSWVVAAETRGYSGNGRWQATNSESGACGPYQLNGWTSCDTSSDIDKLRHHRVAASLPRGSWAVGY